MMLDLLLIQPPVADFTNSRIIKKSVYEFQKQPPLGLCYIASILEKNNFKIKILDMDIFKMSNIQLLNIIKALKPRVIGFSSNSITVNLALKYAILVKEYNPDIIIIFGGHYATLFPEKLIQYEPIDVVVIGEGEYTTLELLENFLRKSGKLEKIRGIIYKTNNKKIIKTLPRPLEKNLDNFPIPATYLILGDAYKKYYSLIAKKNPITSIITSRGCPYNCIFCSKIFNTARFRSADNIIQELEYIKSKYRISDIQIMDSTFNLNRKKNIDLCNQIIKNKTDVQWRAICRPDLVDKELLSRYKRANCYVLTYGVESGSERILKFLKKQFTPSHIKRAFTLTDGFNIETHALFMIGIPGETSQDILKSIKLARQISPTYLQISRCVAVPGTPLYDIAIKYKFFNHQPFIFQNIVVDGFINLKLPNLDNRNIERLLLFNYLTSAINPRFLFKFGRAIIQNPLRFLRNVFSLFSYSFK